MPATRETRSTIEQLVVIDALLAQPPGVTISELASKLGCHKRTVWRRLSWMANTFGVGIRSERWSFGELRYSYAAGEAGVFREEVRRART